MDRRTGEVKICGSQRRDSRLRRPGALTDQVREIIERKIVAGEIPAGQKLNANALAKAIGVSRSPVREALRALEQAELVQAIPNRGVFVRAVDLAEAIDLYDIRIGLARQAGRLLAARVTDEQLGTLDLLYRDMERARASGDADAYHRTNLVFHTRLMEYAGNRALAALDERIKKQLRLFLRKGISGPGQLRMSNADHRALLDAIAAGDAEAAANAYERHSITGKQRMLDTLSRSGAMDSLASRGPRPAGRRSASR
jgi:DNA-binding GntR family transcriptional regulator